jgi:hypothetical protein
MSCSSLPEKLEIKTEEVRIPAQKYQRPLGVPAPVVKLRVITPEVAANLNAQVQLGNIDKFVFFAYSEKDYLTFSQWLQKILSFIKDQNAIIEAYERDVDYHNKKDFESSED